MIFTETRVFFSDHENEAIDLPNKECMLSQPLGQLDINGEDLNKEAQKSASPRQLNINNGSLRVLDCLEGPNEPPKIIKGSSFPKETKKSNGRVAPFPLFIQEAGRKEWPLMIRERLSWLKK